MMTEEQWQEAMTGASAELKALAGLERPLTGEEKKRQKTYRVRKYVLDKIKEASDANRKSDELYNETYYNMLVPWGEKHPVLFFFWMRLLRAKWWGISSYEYDVQMKKGK